MRKGTLRNRGQRRDASDGTSYAVRRAHLEDIDAIRSVRLDALADAPDDFDSTLAESSAWTDSDWQHWLAERTAFLLETPQGLRGIAAGDPHEEDPRAVFLGAMWVHPDLRGTGAADQLVEAVVGWARDRGCDKVWLHVDKRNERARRCYERSGFQVTGTEIVRERDGMPELEMLRRLPG